MPVCAFHAAFHSFYHAFHYQGLESQCKSKGNAKDEILPSSMPYVADLVRAAEDRLLGAVPPAIILATWRPVVTSWPYVTTQNNSNFIFRVLYNREIFSYRIILSY